MRVRKIKNAKSTINEYPNIIIQNPMDFKGKWNELFKNNNPIYIEIGMGKGKFITTNAINNKDINYIGIEKVDSVILRSLEKQLELQLPNLLLINDDASNLLDIFDNGEVKKIYLNFSDPWPKARHEKRRLTYHKFLSIYKEILDGDIEFKTDNLGLFEYSLEEMKTNGMNVICVNYDLHQDNDNIVTTEYEDKFKEKGNKINYLKAEFRSK